MSCAGLRVTRTLQARQPPAQGIPKSVTETAVTSSHRDSGVHPTLLHELDDLLARQPESKWLLVSDLYGGLPPNMRRLYVRPHKSMVHVLEKCEEMLNVSLHPSGLHYCKGRKPVPLRTAEARSQSDEEKCSMTTAELASQISSQQHQQPSLSSVAVSTKKQRPSAEGTAPLPPVAPDPFSTEAMFASDVPPPVDFYYDVGLRDIPAPPPDFDVTPSSLPQVGMQSSTDGAVIALSDFTAYIPSFFVPLAEVLETMPGYTEEHMDRYFRSKAMELVSVGNMRFIRLHGGYAKISLTGCETADARFAKYRPSVKLLEPFVAALRGVQGQWVPLSQLFKRVEPSVVAQLPFDGPAAITYFAQMQHVFSFAVNYDRSVAPSSPNAMAGINAAVLLRPPGYGGLECETTPTPKVCNYLLNIVPMEGSVDIAVMESQIPAPIRAEMVEFFGSLAGFLAAHAPVFHVPAEDSTVVMRTRYKRRLHLRSLPLEEQLRIAVESRDRKRIRAIRRKMAFRDNPAHPFHDTENLAKEISKYLPKRGFVTLKIFLRKNVPEELLQYLPVKIHNFFNNYPLYFQQFEYQQAGTWCVCRPDQTLPRGVIRQDFDEADFVRLVAEYIQQRGPRSCTTILLNLPRGAQDTLKRRHGGLYFFVTKYPQYFNVVLGSDSANSQSSAMVHLVQVPSAELDSTHTAFYGESSPDGLSVDSFEDEEDD